MAKETGNGNGSTALAVIENFPPLARAPGEIQEMIEAVQENLGSVGISVFQLRSFNIPLGGVTKWALTDPDSGENSELSEIEAVVIHHQKARQYYAKPYTGGNEPPDCMSIDCVVGTGDPGGVCANCPNAAFGTKGAAQACAERTWLLLMTPHSAIPVFLNLPPTAQKPWRDFLFRLSCAGRRLSRVVIGIGLVKAANTGGIAYSEPKFRVLGMIPPSQQGAVESYKAALATMLTAPAEPSPGASVTQADAPPPAADFEDAFSEYATEAAGVSE